MTLTARERQVAELLVTGLQDKEVAYALGIGVRTVNNYRAIVFDKCGCRNVVELTRLAYGVRDECDAFGLP